MPLGGTRGQGWNKSLCKVERRIPDTFTDRDIRSKRPHSIQTGRAQRFLLLRFHFQENILDFDEFRILYLYNKRHKEKKNR